jgi:ribosome-associated protein
LNSITIPSLVPTSFGATAAPAPTRPTLPSALERACLAAKTAADNKGQDVLVLDLRAITPIFDFFVLSTGASRRQVHAIVEETDDAMRAVGDERVGVEGYDASKWVVQDYGDVVVHVFDSDTRDYYKLEELWADAPRIDWENELE